MNATHLSVITTVGAVIATLALALNAGAAVKPVPTTGSQAAVEKNATTASSRDTSSLRCWQYGQLLFEKTHLESRTLNRPESTIVFKGDANSDTAPQTRELVLINTGTATCLYEKL